MIKERRNGNRVRSDSRVRYDLRSRNVVMTISGREQDPSDMDYQFNDPHILPVHLYRAPPPSYAEVTETKQNSSSHQRQLQGNNNSSMTPDTEAPRQETTHNDAPPSYENIQPRAN